VLAAASAAASGSTVSSPTMPVPMDRVESAIATRSTYRNLLIKGLAPDEAANLTAFLCGIAVAPQPWKLTEVNQLLFLRALARTGRFGEVDGTDEPIH
jgi:hypothetical protein